MCPGVDSASKNEYQDNPGGKGGRCVRLKTYHLHVPIVKKSGGLNLLEPCGPVQVYNGTALPLRFTRPVQIVTYATFIFIHNISSRIQDSFPVLSYIIFYVIRYYIKSGVEKLKINKSTGHCFRLWERA